MLDLINNYYARPMLASKTNKSHATLTFEHFNSQLCALVDRARTADHLKDKPQMCNLSAM